MLVLFQKGSLTFYKDTWCSITSFCQKIIVMSDYNQIIVIIYVSYLDVSRSPTNYSKFGHKNSRVFFEYYKNIYNSWDYETKWRTPLIKTFFNLCYSKLIIQIFQVHLNSKSFPYLSKDTEYLQKHLQLVGLWMAMNDAFEKSF